MFITRPQMMVHLEMEWRYRKQFIIAFREWGQMVSNSMRLCLWVYRSKGPKGDVWHHGGQPGLRGALSR